MEVDTGACISLIPHRMYEKFFNYVQLVRSDVLYWDVVKCEDRLMVTMKHYGWERKLRLHVLRASRFALMGSDELAVNQKHGDQNGTQSVWKA